MLVNRCLPAFLLTLRAVDPTHDWHAVGGARLRVEQLSQELPQVDGVLRAAGGGASRGRLLLLLLLADRRLELRAVCRPVGTQSAAGARARPTHKSHAALLQQARLLLAQALLLMLRRARPVVVQVRRRGHGARRRRALQLASRDITRALFLSRRRTRMAAARGRCSL